MTIRERFIELLLKTNADMETYKSGIHKGDFKNPVIRKMWLAYHTAWQESREEIVVDLSKMNLLLCDQHDVVCELNKHGLKSKV
ncbi:hypothetical protein DTA24_07755 [Klebsiella sp. P1CD1]|nr:hypothetical protein DTA24_07755 [Klebsiella sp. P1CD1]